MGDLPSLDESVAVALERKGVLADRLPPNVLDGAGTLAAVYCQFEVCEYCLGGDLLNTLDLVGANDDILKGGSVC